MAICLSLTVLLPLDAASAASILQGIYTQATNDAGPIDLNRAQDPTYEALTSPSSGAFIDGVSIDYDWADVELAPGTSNGTVTCPPAPGNTKNCFDFSYYAGQLRALAAIDAKSGRPFKAILSVDPATMYMEPGWQRVGPGRLPPWLFAGNAVQGFATITSGFNLTAGTIMVNGCLPITVPVPWDPVFLADYQALINAFAAYVKTEPNRNLIGAIKLVGLPFMDEGTRLPVASNTNPTAICQNKAAGAAAYVVPDDVAHWKAVGYTPSKLLGAFTTIVQAYQAAFPTMPLEMTTLTSVLPPIDDAGDIVYGSDGLPSRQSPLISSLPLIETASQIVGSRLSVSDHSTNGYRPPVNLFAYSDFGYGNRTYAVGYGLGWVVDADPACSVTGGFKVANDCEGAWAMQSAITESEIGGASYFMLDDADLMQAKYAGVLAAAHRWFTGATGGTTRTLSATRQILDASPWTIQNASLLQAASDMVPPVSIAGAAGPALQYLQETTATATHGSLARLTLTPGQTYAFSVFVSAGAHHNRWLEIVANENTPHASGALFSLNGQVQVSVPVAVGGGPGQAETNGIPTADGWGQLTIQFTAPAAANTLHIVLVEPGKNGSANLATYPGDGTSGVNLWGAQVEPITPVVLP